MLLFLFWIWWFGIWEHCNGYVVRWFMSMLRYFSNGQDLYILTFTLCVDKQIHGRNVICLSRCAFYLPLECLALALLPSFSRSCLFLAATASECVSLFVVSPPSVWISRSFCRSSSSSSLQIYTEEITNPKLPSRFYSSPSKNASRSFLGISKYSVPDFSWMKGF